ncbi:hypothetical protein ACOBQX_15055 [Actinokineospora sp. G85]|uniref:hypothetical protein n=1 Tax=Actinokineospora sp. G85 TaxID=3406626 RepID=UPI003C73A54E
MRASTRPVVVPGRHQAPAPAVVRAPIWLTATFLACALAVVRVVLVSVVPYDRAVGLFDDDAFYYFGVARRLAEGAGSTFNGIDPTNGYHPLWLLLLVPVFAVAHGHLALVAVTCVSSVIAIVCARFIDRVGVHTGRPVLVAVAAAPLLLLGATGPAFFFSGMETGLLLLAVCWLGATYVRTDGFTAPDFGAVRARSAGALMGLVVLARLDAVFPMVLLGLLAALTWRRAGRRWVRLSVSLAVWPAVLLGAYVVVNLGVFGTPAPVSGQAKALGGSGFNLEVVGQFATAPVLFGRDTWLGVLAVVAVVVALVFPVSERLDAAARFGAVVLAGGVLTVGYYALTSSWQLWPWYFSAAPTALAFALPAVVARFGTRVPVRVLAASAVALLVLAATVVNGVRVAGGGVQRAAFIEAGPAVAARIDRLLPLGVPIAVGDRAGSLGYHLTRPLVHLEGLVNSAEYLDALRGGQVDSFLARRGVAFYGRGDAEPGVADPANRGCVRFTEPAQGAGAKASVVVCDRDLVLNSPIGDGASYRVWRYRTELNQ